MKAQPVFRHADHFKKFWTTGNGLEFLKASGWEPDFSNFDRYAPLYHQYDETGDSAVRETYFSMPFPEAAALISSSAENPVHESSDFPENLQKMLLQMQRIPSWFNPELADKGAAFCMSTGTNALIVLRDYSLMGGYDFAYLNKPLIFTGALKKGAVKRLKDTLEFWIAVTRENAMKPGSEAWKLIIRTRMMHSYARLSILKKVKDWDVEKWGIPINSWDMIATWLGFSLVFMQGLRKLNIHITEEEEKGVYHLWKYTGYLLGIPEEFLPGDRREATEIFYLWTSIQDKGDEDSVMLAKALLNENLENTIYPYRFQRKLLMDLHCSVSRFMLDKDVSERLQIPETTVAAAFPHIIRSINGMVRPPYTKDPDRFRKLVKMGHRHQMKVLQDYIRHSPGDFHY